MENSGFKYLVANLVLKGELCVVVWRMVQDLLLQHNKVRTPLNRIPLDQPARCNSEQNLVSPAGAPPSFPGTVSEIQVREKHYTLRNTPKGDDEVR